MSYEIPEPPSSQAESMEFLGVPKDHSGKVAVNRPGDSTEALAGRTTGATSVANMLYVKGDEESALVGLSPEAVWQIQQVLLQAGVAKTVRRGIPDGDTTGPLKRLMEIANLWGTDVFSAARKMADLNARGVGADSVGGGGGGRIGPVYRPPDPATIAQSVKGAIRQQLRRDPTEQELQQLGAELAGFDRQAFNAQVGGGQEVDPSARFAELIESKYADELGFIEDRDEVAVATQQFGQQMSFVDRILGAG